MGLTIMDFPRKVLLRELEEKPHMARTLSPADRAWLGLPALEGASDGRDVKKNGSAKSPPSRAAIRPSLTLVGAHP